MILRERGAHNSNDCDNHLNSFDSSSRYLIVSMAQSPARISVEDDVELQWLYAEYSIAHQRACNVLLAKGEPLEENALRRLLATKDMRDVMRRINEIEGGRRKCA
jgi:hypothetical protein